MKDRDYREAREHREQMRHHGWIMDNIVSALWWTLVFFVLFGFLFKTTIGSLLDWIGEILESARQLFF